MSATPMTLAQRIRLVLAEAAEPIQGHKVAARTGITTREFNRRAAELVGAGHINRAKRPTAGSAGFWYSLNVKQLAELRLECALQEVRGEQVPDLRLQSHELVGRLSFLRMLKEKTVFRDHVVLDLLISDYERCQKLATRAEQA